MNIVMTDEFKLYMRRRRRNIISIMIRIIESGNVGSVKELDIRYNKVPDEVDKYIHYKIKAIDVYVIKNLKVKNDELILSVKRSPWFLKELDIKGIELKM